MQPTLRVLGRRVRVLRGGLLSKAMCKMSRVTAEGARERRGGMGPSVPEQEVWGGWIQQRGGLATPGLKDRMAV